MRSLGAVCVLLLAAVLSCAPETPAGEIAWASSFEAGMKQAKEKGLPVMIDVYTDWCTWCTKLDKEVYTEDNVVALSKKFVCIKLDPEKDTKNGAKYKVEGFPTILFTDSAGKQIHEVVGYLPADKFAAEMKKALELAAKDKSKAEAGEKAK